jgi:uncharacterized membrane protein YfcA
MPHWAEVAALGLTIGVFSGLFGVGGSSISTPLLRIVFGTPSLIELASPLPVTLPTALAGSAVYRSQRLINVRVVAWTAAGGVPSIVAGALLTRWVSAQALMVMVGAAMLAIGLEMMRSPGPLSRPGPPGTGDRLWRDPPWTTLLAIAVPIGFLSGLLANGGGFLFVPAFVLLFGADVREAAATSLPCVALLALPGTVTHALLGHVDGWLAFQLSLGVIPGTYLGARLSLSLRQVPLRRPFGLFMVAFGVYYSLRELLKMF